MKQYFVCILLCCVTLVLPFGTVWGQNEIRLPYYNSFEDKTENDLWQFNVKASSDKADYTDVWYVGDAELVNVLDGDSAMYISDDGEDNVTFGDQSNLVVTYRRFKLPSTITSPIRLELSIDWKTLLNVEKSSEISGLYVAVVDDAVPDVVSKPKITGLPVWLSSRAIEWTVPNSSKKTKVLRNSGGWTSAVGETNSRIDPSKTYKLVIAWVNDGKVNPMYRYMGACVDNIQISDKDCSLPKNFSVNDGCEETVLSWEGAFTDFHIEYRKSGEKVWNNTDDITDTKPNKTYTIPQLPEGVYDFRVRSVGQNGKTSIYNTIYSKLVYCPDNHCLDYVHLKGNPDIECYIGTPDILTGTSGMAKVDAVDHGEGSITGRHTVNTDPNAYDRLTGYDVKVVPDGELASVRIGNLLSGGAEQIMIRHKVDTSLQRILLVNYAIVFQQPTHDSIQQPYFLLKLIDETTGAELDPNCGHAEFYCNNKAGVLPDGWKSVNSPGYGPIMYKPWSYIGFDLADYHGSTLKLHVEVRDCLGGQDGSPGVHFSYAYFTIGCASGHIEGVTCGDVDTMNLAAPIGFEYQWTREDDPGTVLSTQRELTVDASDTRLYTCRCNIEGKPDCAFSVSAKAAARLPHAEFAHKFTAADSCQCKNYVTLINSSHVDNKAKDGTPIHTAEKISVEKWICNGKTFYGDTVVFSRDTTQIIPPEGGQIDVTLIATMSGGCTDTVKRIVDVPSILTPYEEVDSTVCFGESVQFGGSTFGKDTTYTFLLKNVYGCDSSKTLHLDVKDAISTVVNDTICYGQVFKVGDREFRLPVTNEKITLESADGCDSVVRLTLTVNRFLIDLAHDTLNSIVVCADEPNIELPISVLEGEASAYDIVYDNKAVANGFVNQTGISYTEGASLVLDIPQPCVPDNYSANVHFRSEECGDTTVLVKFVVYYADSIIVQKWDDVLAILNENYNGGHKFAAYQWYRDDQLLVGETYSYFRVKEENALDTASTYHVLLTRLNPDGSRTILPTCAFMPHQPRPQISEYPLFNEVPVSSIIKVAGVQQTVEARLYTAVGQLLYSEMLNLGNDEITAPGTAGVYLLVLKRDGLSRHYKIVVK